MRPRALHAVITLMVAACGAAPEQGAGSASRPEPQSAVPASAPAMGTLRQDQLTVLIRAGTIQLRLTPLDERVLRLAAPDTYRRLSAVAEAQREGAMNSREPSLFLVSLFTTEPDPRFEPTDLTLSAGGTTHRAHRILPLTPGWGEQRLQPQQIESAVYVFEGRIDPFQPFTVRYAGESSEGWQAVIPVLHRERSRIAGTGE